ncbi:hypothetical protein SO802_017530 [Lithocarpus litseifolius]|uniref:Uncharacterized protein n=1 Tax=Lithocarpus litseifolius TaxID=425828 RepID=A0AAW2CK49_9ROSI
MARRWWKEEKPTPRRLRQTMVDKRSDSQVGPPSWALTPMLDGAPLLATASIRDFQQGKAGYVADVVEQALLLPEDMADLRSLRRNEVFLSLKRDLAMAVQATLRVKEISNFCHRKMKEEEGRCIAAVEAFNVANKRINELRNKLTEAKRDKKSAEAALDNVERQVEGSASSKVNTSFEVAELGKGGPAKVPPSSDNPSKEAQQHGVAE